MLLHLKENIKYFFFLLLIFQGISKAGNAQGIVINEPDSSWKTKEIPSETLSKKKFTFNRRVYQNLVSHYNYYFNADQTLQRTTARAKAIHKDNYDSLLSVYPYTPPDFAGLKTGLDSVILNAGLGIELHDPRGKWIGDLYLLVGKANFYKQNDEEAVKTFKYMIKNLGEHDETGHPGIVGSRSFYAEEDIPVLTPEKKKKHPHARNDAFIWLIRSYLHLGANDKATALLNEVKTDPQLPDRLRAPYYAAQTIYLLKENKYDSAAQSLSTAITFQPDKKLQARWQYLLSQLYERQKRWAEAGISYQKVSYYKPSPVLKFYAHLNQIRIRILQNPERFAINSELMLDMAKRERYSRYRGVIYYQLGKLAIQTGHFQKGAQFLKNSLRFNPEEKEIHGLSYSLLADQYYKQKEYETAKKYYDSALNIISNPKPEIKQRQAGLIQVVKNLKIISREDSLQALARMPNDSLMAFLGNIVDDSMRAYRKKNRILTGDSNNDTNTFGITNEKKSLTGNSSDNTWYFYNDVAKSRGFSQFKAKWGNRPLADNWRLSAPNQPVNISSEPARPIPVASAEAGNNMDERAEKLLQQLLKPLPLTKEAMEKSDKAKMNAQHKLINAFFLQLNDDSATLSAIRKMQADYPENPYMSDIYYKLYLIYSHIPDAERADHYKQVLLSGYADSPYAGYLSDSSEDSARLHLEKEIEDLYNTAYISYLSGDYEKIAALQDSALYLDAQNKQKARFDLLHAMSIFKTQTDSAGQVALQKVIQNNPADTAIVRQAKLILEKLQHKEKLIEHLLHLQPDTTNTNYPDSLQIPVEKTTQNKKPDTSSPQKEKNRITTPYQIDRHAPYFVIFSLKKPENNLLKRSLNYFAGYNQKNHGKDSVEVSAYKLANDREILIFRLFKNEKEALLYYKEIKAKITDIIPDAKPDIYRIFFISRNNFILLNNTKDWEGYLSFFYKHYK